MRRLFSLTLLILGTLALGSAQAQPQILTSIKPLQLIAAAVQQGVAKPDVLLPAGASAHHYSLRPSDIRRLHQADLFYWIGPSMEGFLVEVLKQRPTGTQAVQELPDLYLQYFGEAEHHHHEDETEADHADAEHQAGSLDAHLWLSSVNARLIAQRMAKDLSQLDPEHAQTYHNNLAAFMQRLDQLDLRLKQQLAPIAAKPFFVFHEAYNYFEQAYGLTHRAAFHFSEENTPGARYVAQLRTQLQETGPSCLFNEPPVRPRLAQSLTQGLPVTLAELDALGGSIPVTAQGYEQLLEHIGQSLSQCLGALP